MTDIDKLTVWQAFANVCRVQGYDHIADMALEMDGLVTRCGYSCCDDLPWFTGVNLDTLCAVMTSSGCDSAHARGLSCCDCAIHQSGGVELYQRMVSAVRETLGW